uniref:Pyrroline-5-carboxylate reductase n=1 Tax=Herpetomonas muscarum TaxID=5718 RepID=U5KMS5_HERMU|nr:pyrroline-5-carboxylate reductase [Herpetomonas muscarum]
MPQINKTFGFIGCGSMAECIMAGMLKSGTATPKNVYVCNRTESTMKRLADEYGVQPANALELTEKCDVIFLGVKPYGITAMLDMIKGVITPPKLIVSMAAGVTIDTMEKHLPANTKLIRVMPNIPCFVGCGMTSVTANKSATEEDTAIIVQVFESIGKAAVVPESGIHAVIGVAGSSSAYTFMYMEALADGAVRGGLPRARAYEMAAQAVLGAAKMLQETGKTPGALKDMVCSPGGTTIEAVRFLEKGGFRSTVIEGMIAAMDKSKQMEETYKE